METPTARKIVMALSTATVVLFTSGFTEKMMPSEIHHISGTGDTKSWDEYLQTPYYTISREAIQNINQITILHEFASRLIERSEDIDPTIAKIINRNFSKLL
jgi:hypothetical protein